MKGIMFTAQGRAEILEEPEPTCQADAVLLETLYSGLSNGTERMFLCGGNYGGSRWPQRIGYQHVSRVIACGERITRFAVGDVVFTGTYPGHVERHLARESDLIARLPEGMDLPAAAMLGVASVAWHDCRRGRVTPEDRVLVIGAGLIGQFAAQSARARGAHVTLADRHADRLALAADAGIDRTVDLADESGWQALDHAAPFSVILECSGGEVLDRVIGRAGEHRPLVARRGRARLVLVAGRYEVGYNFNAAGAAELDIIHTQHFDQQDLDQVVRLAARGDLQPRPLISHLVNFDQAPEIYAMLRDRTPGLLGAVFKYPAASRVE